MCQQIKDIKEKPKLTINHFYNNLTCNSHLAIILKKNHKKFSVNEHKCW